MESMRTLASLGLLVAAVSAPCYDPVYFTGNGAGHEPFVSVNTVLGPRFTATAFAPGFLGGVFVAMGDINGDGAPELLCGQGEGGESRIRAYDGLTGSVVLDTLPFGGASAGGARVALGDVSGDGLADVIVGSGPGVANRVRVLDAVTGLPIRDFAPFDASFTGGVFVAAGDVNGDGFADIVTGAGSGMAPRTVVFDGVTGDTIWDYDPFFGSLSGFAGGVRVGCGDYDGDGRGDLFAATDAGIPSEVFVNSGRTGLNMLSWSPFGDLYNQGVHIAGADVDEDGLADVVVHGFGARIRVMNATSLANIVDYEVRPNNFAGHLSVAGGESKAAIRANLLFPGRVSAAPPMSVVVRQLRLSNNQPYPTHVFVENRSGQDRFWTPFIGANCNFYLKGPNTVGVRVGNVAVADGLDLGSLTLFVGDINGDDSINIQDFLALRQNFGTSSGGPGFNPQADLDGNGSVGISDFLILRSNFGRSGPGLGA